MMCVLTVAAVYGAQVHLREPLFSIAYNVRRAYSQSFVGRGVRKRTVISDLTHGNQQDDVCLAAFQWLKKTKTLQSFNDYLLLPDPVRGVCIKYFNKNCKELWRTFKYTGLDPHFFQLICNLKLIKNKREQENNVYDLEFVPSEETSSDYKRCLEALKIHASQFQKGKTDITNFEFDLLKRKTMILADHLRSLSLQHQLPSDEKREWLETYSIDDVISFFSNIERNLGRGALDSQLFLFVPIINGVPFQITYTGGLVKSAFAIGLGEQKVDITDLIRTMEIVPKVISETGTITVSGCLFLNTKDFHLRNLERRGSEKKDWLDTRTAITCALLNSEEPNKFLERKLQCYFDQYHIGNNTNAPKTLSDVFDYLSNQRFPTLPRQYVIVGTAEQASAVFGAFENLPFESSGIVIKTNDLTTRSLVKVKDCYYKFIPKFEKTIVDRVDFSVLPNGNIISLIRINPITIGEKIVGTLLINNETAFLQSDARVKDTVLVSSYPGMLPRLVKSYRDSSSEPVVFPSHCPKCNAVLSKTTVDGKVTACCSSHLSCINDDPVDIAHFASIHGLNIPSLSNNVISELMKKTTFSSIADLFSLTIGDHDLLENIPFETFEKLLSEIEVAKHTTLARFIYALNIPSVTLLMAEELAYTAGTIDRLSKMSAEELSELEYIDKEVVKNIRAFFLDSKKQKEMKRLLLPDRVSIAEPNKDIMDLCYKNIALYTESDYTEIVQKIQDCNKHYNVTDFEFDLLNKTAEKIEKLHPQWILSRLPQQQNKELVSWKDPISHLRKTYFNEELKLFCKEMQYNGIIVEPKVNGIACSLQYQQGKLLRALTKHDARSGYDITDCVRNKSIPPKLSKDFTGIIRGELFISDKDLQRINDEREKSGLEPYKDSLAVVLSAIQRKERNAAIHNALQFFGYHLVLSDDDAYTQLHCDFSQADIQNFLKDLGFSYDLGMSPKIFADPREAIKYATDIEARRHECLANIDGMVLKAPNLEMQRFLESKGYPVGALAYKFKLEKLSTCIQSIIFSVDRSGKLLATANVRPIKFSNNREVSRVSIPVKKIPGLYGNDKVYITYSGGVSPVLEPAAKQNRAQNAVKFELPTTCPTCERALNQNASGVIQCSNRRCVGPTSLPALSHFAEVMNIADNTIVKKIFSHGLVITVSDFYKLLPEELSKSGIKKDQAQQLLARIENSKNATTEQLLFALNIGGVGKVYAQQLASVVSNFSELSTLTFEDLCSKKGIPPSIASATVDYFTKNKNSIDHLIKIGVTQSKNKGGTSKAIDLATLHADFLNRQASISDLMRTTEDAIKKSIQANQKDLDLLNMIQFIKAREVESMEYSRIKSSINTKQTYFKRILKALSGFPY